jgi:hypothetical protein
MLSISLPWSSKKSAFEDASLMKSSSESMLVVAGVAKSYPFFLSLSLSETGAFLTDEESESSSFSTGSSLRAFPELEDERLKVAFRVPTATGGSVAAVVVFAASAAFLFLVRGGVVKSVYW